MVVLYVRQTSEHDPLQYLNGPQDFNLSHLNSPCYKNVIFLTHPDETEKTFYVRSVGFEVSDPQKAIINRYYPAGSILHYIIGGEGTFNGKPIRAGDCAVAFHDRPHSIVTNPEKPLCFYWIIIRHDTNFCLGKYGFRRDPDIFPCSFMESVKKLFREMLSATFSQEDAYCFFLSHLYRLLSWHRYNCDEGESNQSISGKYSKYATLAKRMWEQADYLLSVQEVAEALGISRKHFSSVFFGETGKKPHLYVLEHKIRTAQLQIDSGDENFKAMALQLGYKDYSSFFRAFKSVTGIGPREYAIKTRTDRK